MGSLASFLRRSLNEEAAVRAATVIAEVLLLLLLLWATRRVVDRLIRRLIDRAAEGGDRMGADGAADARMRTIGGMLNSLAGFVVLFVFGVAILHAAGVNVAGLLTTAGIGGLAIGFGAQKLVRDTISGFFIVMDGQFAVGDYVTIGPATGFVEDLSMRVTRIRDDQGRAWIVANGDISTVTNHSRGPVISYVDVPVSSAADSATVRRAVDELGRLVFEADPGALLEAWRCSGVIAFDGATLTLRVDLRARPGCHAAEQARAREAVRERLRTLSLLPVPPVQPVAAAAPV
jgi:small conductance mechanosensitive channel